MAYSNLTLCYEGIQRVYRNTVVRHIRDRLTVSFGDDAAGCVRKLLAKEWDGIKRNADESRSAGYVNAPLADDFDVLSVSHFFSLFEKFHAALFPATDAAGAPFPDSRRKALLAFMREIKAIRDPMSHPGEADLPDEDAARVLDTASRVLGGLGYESEAKEVKRLYKRVLDGDVPASPAESPLQPERITSAQITDPAPVSARESRENGGPRAARWGWAALGLAAAVFIAFALVRPGRSPSTASLDAAVAASAPKESAQTRAQYEAACDAGTLAACDALAALYVQGDGVAQDYGKAFDLYNETCDRGSALGCVKLGVMDFDGIGMPKHESVGAGLFLRGCEAGEPLGCLKLAVVYGEGAPGISKDPERSFALAERACKGGLPRGCARVSACKVSGLGVAKDVKGGLAQLDALCTQGEQAACEALADFYKNGVPGDLPADPVRLREYTAKACKLGADASCKDDHMLRTIDFTENRVSKGNALYQEKCDHGSATECGLLGENVLAGIGASPDRAKGMALLEKACRGGFDRACGALVDAGGSSSARP
jgi:TPR repeat protein